MKKNLLLLLSAIVLASCGQQPTDEPTVQPTIEPTAAPTETPTTDPTVEPTVEETQEPTQTPTEEPTIEPTIEVTPEPGIEVSTPYYKEKNITHYLGSDNDIYRINISTEGNEFPVDKENYVTGSLNISEQDSSIVVQEEMDMKIKLRGNSTLGADKKPFKIKFEKKQSLFGLEKAKDWVLLANYYDKSNIRNYLAYLMANKLDNLDFQPSSIFVDVYFNNEYLGLYLLCEQIEGKEGRADVEDKMSAEGINSFLLEADERAKDEYAGYQGSCYVTSGGYDFALKSPDADDYVEALDLSVNGNEEEKQEAQETLAQFVKDTTWLQTFLDETSNAIYNLDNYENYIDVDSFIDFYLVQEFFKNVDVGSTSQFYTIDQTEEIVKLKAGPVWDFDISCGIVDNSRGQYQPYHYSDLWMAERDYFCKALLKDKHFYRKVAERYTEIREDVVLSVFDEMELVLKILEKAQQRNIQKWPLTKERKTWVEQYALSDSYLNIESLQDHYSLVEETLSERLAILDRAYLL